MLRAIIRHRWIALGIGLAAMLGTGALAVAVIPAEDGVIQGCYAKVNGQLRVADSTTCLSSEVPISWNAQGPPGAPGPTFGAVNGGANVEMTGTFALVSHDVTTPSDGPLYVTGSVDISNMTCERDSLFCVAYVSLWVDGQFVPNSGSRYVIDPGATRPENVMVFGVTGPASAGSHTVELRMSRFGPVSAQFENQRTGVILLGDS